MVKYLNEDFCELFFERIRRHGVMARWIIRSIQWVRRPFVGSKGSKHHYEFAWHCFLDFSWKAESRRRLESVDQDVSKFINGSLHAH